MFTTQSAIERFEVLLAFLVPLRNELATLKSLDNIEAPSEKQNADATAAAAAADAAASMTGAGGVDIPLNAEVVNQQLAAGGRVFDNALSAGMRIEYWYNEELGWLQAQVSLPLRFCLSVSASRCIFFSLFLFVSLCARALASTKEPTADHCADLVVLSDQLFQSSARSTPPAMLCRSHRHVLSIYLPIHSPAHPSIISSIFQLLSCQRLAGEVLWWKVKFLSDGTTEHLKLNVDTKARWRILRSSE